MSRSSQMKLKRELEKQGFICERSGSGHWRVTHPEREGVVMMSFSPRTERHPKLMKKLREFGFKE